jgi:hypothetical protein
MTPKGQAAVGATMILAGLVLVPLIWGCGDSISGWNVLIFGLVAFGSSQFGAAVGRWSNQRVAGIGATIAAVLASLFAIGVLTAGTC